MIQRPHLVVPFKAIRTTMALDRFYVAYTGTRSQLICANTDELPLYLTYTDEMEGGVMYDTILTKPNSNHSLLTAFLVCSTSKRQDIIVHSRTTRLWLFISTTV